MVKKITGYHGTVKDNSTLILQNGFKINTYSFLITARQPIPGDLGAGLYAYQDDIENAKRFAHKFQYRVPGTHTIRLRSVGRLGGSNLMNDRTSLRVDSFFDRIVGRGDIVDCLMNYHIYPLVLLKPSWITF